MTSKSLMTAAIVSAGVASYMTIAGLTGFCPMCKSVTDSVFGGATPVAHTTQPEDGGEAGHAAAEADGFRVVNREGSVDIETAFDLTGLSIPRDEIHTLLPVDAIPALTDPRTQGIDEADFLADDARIIVVEVGGEVLGVPLAVLNFHEIVNTTIGGEPVAATYCPLCDSATVFKRTVGEDDDAAVLEFGVSGALYNSNVIMYDRTDRGLWSQLALGAVSGPRAGASLEFLPVRIVSKTQFAMDHPGAPVVSNDTGHERDYSGSPYTSFFENPDYLLVPVSGVGDALPLKTLGLGILAGEKAYFVSADAIGEEMTIPTGSGDVVARATEAGIDVLEAPKGVRTAQAFYYSWSAFHPRTEVIGE